MSECKHRGFSDLEFYQRALDLPDTYARQPGETVFLPVYSTQSLTAPDANVTHAVVWIHGLSGDANTYFCDGAHGARDYSSSTVTVAPWFGNEQVSKEQWTGSGTGVSSFWGTSRWLTGGNNSPSPSRFTTSFDALDAVYLALAGSGQFPNLRAVTFAGYSAGAQLVSRWALFTDVALALDARGVALRTSQAPLASRAATQAQAAQAQAVQAQAVPAPQAAQASTAAAALRFIVSDASTYVYLDGDRPASSCSPARSSTSTSHFCAHWDTAASAPEAACPGYDAYK